MYSVITPIYRNAESIPLLIDEFARIDAVIRQRFGTPVEFIFVIDASPDDGEALLEEALPRAPFRSQLISHARNFGSFAAVRTGLQTAKGDCFAVIAADLQEPPEILVSFLEMLQAGGSDIAVGVRRSRADPAMSRLSAELFWRAYRRFIIPDLPPGGVDVFACNKMVRDELLKLDESHASMLGQLYWLGFRKAEVGYDRRGRASGKSAWTFRKKVTYLLDSIFAFTNLPIIGLTLAGLLGTICAVVFGLVIGVMRLTGAVDVPGYAATMVVIMFFGALNMFGLGIVGAYTWRAYENTKRRPLTVVRSARSFAGTRKAERPDPVLGESS
jgi:glycosyltransferase involved in cell wall biosynthesis